MSKFRVALLLFSLIIASGCGGEEIPGIGFRPNLNLLPPAKYNQSALEIPNSLNDPFYLSTGAWGNGYLDLFGFHDVSVFGEYSKLSLPAQEIVVAVIDTGIDRDHEDLVGRLWVNPGESADDLYNNGIDDDGDGYVDDFLGWNFVNDRNNPADDMGHGTHVAGTIAAIGNNGKGIVGVAPWVRLMALKVCNTSGSCESSDIRAAIAYAAKHGAKVINLSLGAEDEGADAVAFDKAISDANAQGAVVVASSGNAYYETSAFTPANATYSLAVGAYSVTGHLCEFSNTGWRTDVTAPGCGVRAGVDHSSAILSLNSQKCGPFGDQYCTVRTAINTSYSIKAGTSMSAPHAAGMAAVAWTASPTATPLQIRQALIRTSRAVVAGKRDYEFAAGKISGVNLYDEARSAIGIKITSPRYNTSAKTFNLGFRIEARDYPVTWKIRILPDVASNEFDLTGGVEIGVGGTVPAGTSVDLQQPWSPAVSGNYLVTLEGESNGQYYYDTVRLRAQ